MQTLKDKALLIGKLKILSGKLSRLNREIGKIGFNTDPDLNIKYWKLVGLYKEYQQEAKELQKEYNKLFYNKG